MWAFLNKETMPLCPFVLRERRSRKSKRFSTGSMRPKPSPAGDSWPFPGHVCGCLDCGLGNVTGIQRAKVRDAVQTPQCTTVTPHKTGNIHSKCQECRGPETMKSVIHSDVCVLLAQSYSTLCDPRDCSPPGSSVHGMLQTRIWSGLPCPPPGGILQLRDATCVSDVSCIGRRVLYHWRHLGSTIRPWELEVISFPRMES